MPFPNPETMFRPGQSGNPKGRPKAILATALRERLDLVGDDGRSVADRLAQTLINLALSGDLGAIREILNRVDGKVCKAADEPGTDYEVSRPRIVIPSKASRIGDLAPCPAPPS